MKIQIEIDDEKLKEVVLEKVAEELVNEYARIVISEGKMKRVVTYEVKHAVENIFNKHMSEFESAVVGYTKSRMKGSVESYNGRLRTAMEKALKELEDEDER